MNETNKPGMKESCNCGCKPIRGTETERNLANAFIAESCAASRYSFFAKCAEKESYFQIANIFRETASNELHHAKVFLKYLHAGSVTSAPISVDAGVLKPTAENLRVAIQEESTEGVDTYVAAAKVAEREGLHEIASRFMDIASIEQQHKQRFERMLRHLEEGTMWKREKSTRWVCLVCGYVAEGTEPPQTCPACKHPYQHFASEE